jgi:hypothetical protein
MDTVLKTSISRKFAYLLESVEEEQKAKLAAELAQMLPVSPESEMDWRVGWVYLTQANAVESGFALKINPCQRSESSFELFQLIEMAIINGTENQLDMLDQALDRVIDHAIPPYTISFFPSVYLAEDMAAIHFNIKGMATEYVRQTIFKKKLKFLKKQQYAKEKKEGEGLL